jgi:L-histidine Nalpha-methyltransferase
MSMRPSAVSGLPDTIPSTLADDVAESLRRSPRQLSSQYLYDRLGSSLFEAICRLPWYRVTAIEQQLLDTHAADVFDRLGPVSTIVELGPGSGEKLLTLVSGRVQSDIVVHLVDVSAEALEQATRTLAGTFDVRVITHQATYEAGLAAVDARGRAEGKSLVLFLGSNIGNFDPAGADTLLRGVRRTIRHGDALLLGADLVKPESELLLAYDDPLGVTAAFNRNLLVRLNRELGSDFDLAGFDHGARWNAEASRVEMHLVSVRRQRVRIPASNLDITFESGETIWTESSYKYRSETIDDMGRRAGFQLIDQWVEGGFALSLFEAV